MYFLLFGSDNSLFAKFTREMTGNILSNHTFIMSLTTTTVLSVHKQFIIIGFELPDVEGSVHHN